MSVNVGNVYRMKKQYVIVVGYSAYNTDIEMGYPIYLRDIQRRLILNPYYFENKDKVVRAIVKQSVAIKYACLIVDNEDFMRGPKKGRWIPCMKNDIIYNGKYVRKLGKEDLNKLLIKASMQLGAPEMLSFEEMCEYTKKTLDAKLQMKKKEYTETYWKKKYMKVDSMKALGTANGLSLIVKNRNKFEVWQINYAFPQDNTVFAYYKKSFKKSEFYEMLWYCEQNHKHDVYKNGITMQLKPLEYFKGRSYVCR